jgi:hypothetical protein
VKARGRPAPGGGDLKPPPRQNKLQSLSLSAKGSKDRERERGKCSWVRRRRMLWTKLGFLGVFMLNTWQSVLVQMSLAQSASFEL